MTKEDEWGFHSAKVNCVSWSPDSTMVASGSLDTSIIVWSVEKPAKHLIIKSKDSISLLFCFVIFHLLSVGGLCALVVVGYLNDITFCTVGNLFYLFF